MIAVTSRRELATRRAPWARRLASSLRRAGVRPNTVSVTSVLFAFAALAAFLLAPRADGGGRAVLFVAAAAAIQLRLLCNLLDGMLAVEEGLRTTTGDLFNEIPDRLADVVILAGAGCSIPDVSGAALLGYAAAMAAVLTAYVRVLGGSLGLPQRFTGPMAKPHRMFVLTLGSIASAMEAGAGMPPRSMRAALAVIVVGAIATTWMRITAIARELEAR